MQKSALRCVAVKLPNCEARSHRQAATHAIPQLSPRHPFPGPIQVRGRHPPSVHARCMPFAPIDTLLFAKGACMYNIIVFLFACFFFFSFIPFIIFALPNRTSCPGVAYQALLPLSPLSFVPFAFRIATRRAGPLCSLVDTRRTPTNHSQFVKRSFYSDNCKSVWSVCLSALTRKH